MPSTHLGIKTSETIRKIEPLPKDAELEKVYNSIDPMLKNAMCLLWGYNIITRYSCQGHIESKEGHEEGYIYMDFDMLAFNALSKVMFQVDDIIRNKYRMKDNGNRIWYYPYILIERGVRKVDDNYSRDELIVRFNFHPLNIVDKEEFYSIFTKLLAIALEDEKEIELLKYKTN